MVLLLVLGACTDSADDRPIIQTVKSELTIDSELTTESELPTNINGVEIEWQSSKDNILTTNYEIIQGLVDLNVTLTAVLSYENSVTTKIFNVVISKSSGADNSIINTAIDSFNFNEYVITKDITLPNTIDGVSITWSSSDSAHLDSSGIVTRPLKTESDATVILTGSFSYNDSVKNENYIFTITAAVTSVVFESYYSGAEELTNEALKTFLHNLIDGHNVVTYSQLTTYLRVSDVDPLNSSNIILFYSGRSQANNTNGGSQDQWNREHVWPRSHGDLTSTIANTDMHHVQPTDVSVNGDRAALDFDIGGTEIYDMGFATGSYKDSDSFEPRDEVKGDVARILFYMAVRYDGSDGVPDLEINDLVNNRNSRFIGRLSVLLQWHIDDPVDTFEINRNEVNYSYQGNRNPFIDHPEFVEEIWGTN